MTSRRDFLAAAAATFGLAPRSDLDELYRTVFGEDGTYEETATMPIDSYGNASFTTSWVDVDATFDDTELVVLDWWDTIGLAIDFGAFRPTEDAPNAKAAVELSMDEARQLRDLLSIVIAANDRYGTGDRPGQ